ncbi:MAG: hypothetical protein U0974_04695 [Gemmatimonadales bacterium]|nr:hypothetical protein [Gemmatimonadales bacterium]MDZ4389008.1 hypothetical protein [Gemmatimonadales bacterium]
MTDDPEPDLRVLFGNKMERLDQDVDALEVPGVAEQENFGELGIRVVGDLRNRGKVVADRCGRGTPQVKIVELSRVEEMNMLRLFRNEAIDFFRNPRLAGSPPTAGELQTTEWMTRELDHQWHPEYAAQTPSGQPCGKATITDYQVEWTQISRDLSPSRYELLNTVDCSGPCAGARVWQRRKTEAIHSSGEYLF